MLKNYNQGNIALILVIMITSLTLVSAVALTLVNVSEKLANYHLTENENVLNQKQACLDEALLKINDDLYATGTYAVDLSDVHCYYQISETISGLKTVTTTAASLSSLGAWSQSLRAIINVSTTPMSIDSYQDIVGATWDSSAWTRRMRISVQPNKVAGDLYNFPVYLNLADLGSDFFYAVRSNGNDIVITAGDGQTKLLRELSFIDKTNSLGEVHFLAPYLSAEVATDFYVYFGNVDGAEADDDGMWTNYQMVQHLTDNPFAIAPQMIDSTDNGNQGTSNGTMLAEDLVTAQVGKGLDFDGGDDYVSFANRNDFSTATGTISFWLNFNTLQDSTIFHFYEVSTTDYIRSYYSNTSGYLDLMVEDGDAAKINVQYISPNTTGWHKIDWLQDGTGVKLYFDGQLKSLTEVVQSGSWWSDHLSVAYANLGGTAWGYLAAKVDEFRVIDKALSANWLATEYNNQVDSDTFYSTTTVEVLGVYTPPVVCDGVSMFDYCWYMASNVGMSCDQVCAENGGLTCVSDVSYGPDTTCALNLALGPPVPPSTCSLLCMAGGGLTYDPGNHVSSDVCLYDTTSPAISCGTTETSGGAYRIICACE